MKQGIRHAHLWLFLLCATGFSLLSPEARAQDSSDAQVLAGRSAPWSERVLELFATLPVQDGGRVKPMSSVAGMRMLTLNGKRSLELDDETKLGQVEWLMDCLFFPEQASDYKCFRVQNDAVLIGIGVKPKSKRDWYSYNELYGGLEKLQEEARRIHGFPEERKKSEEHLQTLKLASDIHTFYSLVTVLVPARMNFPVADSETLLEIFGSEQLEPGIAPLMPHFAQLQALRSISVPGSEDFEAVQRLFDALDMALREDRGALMFMPPLAGSEDEATWWTTTDVVVAQFMGKPGLEKHLGAIASFEKLERLKHDPAAFEKELESMHAGLVGLAEARGEYKQIPLEVKFYKWDLFTNSLVFFLLAFLLAAVGWLAPGSRFLGWATSSVGLIALGLLVTGIVMRCIIRSRPPVVSLYDTILFITAVTVIVSMFIEWVTRERIALAVSTVLGAGGMFLAGRYELKEVASAGDTMASVVAVLDTNYYLAIHVTTITMGYAGGLLAGAIGHVWILGKLFGLRKGDKAFYKSLTRMTYGVICFSLLFAVFGTIMGGVWANDSWGRFWGWDPKENGALLICIWELIIVHARKGGYIKDRGLAVMSVLTAVVVSASWWGVNLLEVGLHSYGFTSGAMAALGTMWGVEAFVVLLAGVGALMSANSQKDPTA